MSESLPIYEEFEFAWSDKEAKSFLFSSGIARTYQSVLDKWLENFDEKEAHKWHSEHLAWHRSLLYKNGHVPKYDLKDVPKMVNDGVEKDRLRHIKIAQADLPLYIGKIGLDSVETYWVYKRAPNGEYDDAFSDAYGYLRDVLYEEGKKEDDPYKFGFTSEQVQAAVDYVDARIANNGAPLYE